MITETLYNSVLGGNPILILPDGQISNKYSDNFGRYIKTLIPGSFNPLHKMHKYLYHKACGPSAFEVSIYRKDKVSYSINEINQIISQFEWYAPILITNAPTFLEKIGLLDPYCQNEKIRFHIGYDVAKRLLDEYGLFGVQGIPAYFVVCDRIINGTLFSICNWDYKPENMSWHTLDEICKEEVSSTALRNNK